MKIDGKLIYNLFHNVLSGLQGGKDGEYYHLTEAEYYHHPERPFIISPKDNEQNINQVPQIHGSPYSSEYGWSMFKRALQIATNNEFTNIVYEVSDEMSSSVIFQVPLDSNNNSYLEPNTTYYIRVRYCDKRNRWSEWSHISKFTTIAEFPEGILLAPIMTIPTEGGQVRSNNPIFGMTSPKTMVGTAVFDKADWQIANHSTFTENSILYEANNTTNLTLHQTEGVSLASANTLDFYARGRQGTNNNEWTPWSSPVRFGIRPEYDDPVFGTRKVFSYKYNTNIIFQIDPEGNIINIPHSYFDKHPLYQFPEHRFTHDGDIIHDMVFIPPSYMKCNVYDNDDGDLVIDTWYSPILQEEEGWILEPSFVLNPNGYYTDIGLAHIITNNNIACYIKDDNRNRIYDYPSNLIKYITNLTAIDNSYHLWNMYERRYLLDLMVAEYCTIIPSKISTLTTTYNTSNINQFKYRNLYSLVCGDSYTISSSSYYNHILTTGVNVDSYDDNYIKKINVALPNMATLWPFDIYIRMNNNGKCQNILRGYYPEFGFNVALLGIPSVTSIESDVGNEKVFTINGMNITGDLPPLANYNITSFIDNLFLFNPFHSKRYIGGMAINPMIRICKSIS